MSVTKHPPRRPTGRYEVRVMSVAEWIAVPDNPRQRNTDARLKKAMSRFLVPSPTHAVAAMAVTRDGQLCWKLDAHTRALFWQIHPELAPNHVQVDIYLVEDAKEAADLYLLFDNPDAAETASDRLFGAQREQNWQPTSGLFTRGRYTNALRYAHAIQVGQVALLKHRIPVHELVQFWLPELKIIDAESFRDASLTGPLLIAALITLRKYGSVAIQFWRKYARDEGDKIGKEVDGVEALHRVMRSISGRSRGGGFMVTATGFGLSAFEAWRSTRTYRSLPKSTDPFDYAAGKRFIDEVKQA